MLLMKPDRDSGDTRDKGFAWAILACNMLVWSVVAINDHGYGIFSTEFKATFGWSEVAMGQIASMRLGLSTVIGLISGPLTEKFGPRPVCLVAIVMSAIAHVVSSFASDKFLIFTMFGLLAGLGAGLSIIPSIIIIQSHFDKHRALAGGLSAAGHGVFTIFISPLMRLAADYYGWRGAMLIVGGMVIQTMVPASFYRPYKPVRENRIPRAQQTDVHTDISTRGRVKGMIRYYFDKELLNRTFVFYVITQGTKLMITDAYNFRLVPLGITFGFDPVSAAFLPSAVAVCATSFRAASGILAKATSPAFLYGFMTLWTSVVVFIVPFLPRTFAVHLACAILFGVGIGCVVGIQFTCLVTLVGLKKLPLALAWMSILVGIIRILGNLLVGWLIGVTGSYDVSLWFVSVINAGGSLFSLYLAWSERQLDK